jgi:hypothetical protein
MPKITGYAFYGESDKPDEHPVLFIRRANPFLSGARLYVGLDDGIKPYGAPILRFAATVDFLAIGGVCYILSSSIEKDFSFENRHLVIARRRLSDIFDAGVIGNHESFEKAVMTPKNARKFLDFDHEVLEHIAKLTVVERIEFLETYGVEVDPGGRMDTYSTEQCEYVIDLLCGRSCLDPLGRLSIGSNITRR